MRRAADSHHIAFENVAGIFNQVEPAFVGDISIERCLDVVLAAVEAVLAALADDRRAAGAIDEVQVGAFGLDGRRPEDEIDREIVCNRIQN